MAETEESCVPKEGEKEEEDDEPALNYQPPAEKTINEILKADEDDDSLVRYKQKLLGSAAGSTNIILYPDNPNKVILQKLILKVDSRPDVVISLIGDLSKLCKNAFVIKEGCKYRMQIDFYVQRDIVCGLNYYQTVYRKGIRVDNFNHMVGSYGPSKDLVSYLTPSEDAPSGLISRGTYTVRSKFVDDDGIEYLKWEWAFEITKEWK
ncbi:rho GDP-dissociation inhibitor 1 isoform X2 [Octopus bimaculoides]|uniref:Rho GDP-dissociation inhibitor 3 n=2 Tax=Octopus bimaculoides TaxID=37653 RepID=A0A0L8FMD3_OCTBM|nr:rho GDP-dissociation inhibitor 1 isoform X2 [Octopus bimaculoides]|eukprot:XP_014788749.1 PREDICTED: rho GDP-dissociation inhibitor 1-like isoform X2 [Octopus bimaculoides]